MDRTEKMLSRVDPASQVGVEIGPLDKPVVRREEGVVYYVDHGTREELAAHYADDPAVDDDAIVDVDFVWGAQTLDQLLGDVAPVDYVAASHVVEHVPDLVGWLREVAAVLRPGGILALVVPDRRFTFDYLRDVSTTADLIGASLDGLRRPSPSQVYRHISHVVDLDATEAWSGAVSVTALNHKHTIDDAIASAREAAEGTYVDCHCWIFTPDSFLARLGDLVELGMLDFAVAEIIPTAMNELEFYVSLERLDPGVDDETTRGIQRRSLAAARASIAATAPVPSGGGSDTLRLEDVGSYVEALRSSNLELEAARREIDRLGAALEERDHRLDEVAASTSWRVTAPLRFVGRTLSRLRS